MVLNSLASLTFFLLATTAIANVSSPLICVESWKPNYHPDYGITHEFWLAQCAKGLSAEQILAALQPASSFDLEAHSAPALKSSPAAKKVFKSFALDVEMALAKGDVAGLYGEHGGAPPPAKMAVSAGILPAPTGADQIGKSKGSSTHKPPIPDAPNVSDGSCSAPFTGGPGWYQAASKQLACLPGIPYRSVFIGYLQRTGLHNYKEPEQIGGSNQGLNNFYGGLAKKDPAFLNQLFQFYEKVGSLASKQKAPANALDKVAGEGENKDVAPGWIWKEALAAAKGDSNRAMRLIGFCGHDDVAQSKITRGRTPEEAAIAMGKREKEIISRITRLERALAKAKTSSHSKKLASPSLNDPADIKAITAQLEVERLFLHGLKIEYFLIETIDPCPLKGSIYYLPRSLDAKADIPDDLKKKIAKTQAGGEDKLGRLPAKYYHVMGAAAASCEMIRDGAPAWLASTVQSRAAWTYRTLRLKAQAERFGDLRAYFHEAYEKYRSALPHGEKPLPEEDYREQLNEKRRTQDEAVSLPHIDAFDLMERWGYGGKVLGMDVPPIDIRVGVLSGKLFKSKPEGWSDKRFEAAKKRMEIFLNDWEWTRAEHEAGAAFAAKVCREEKAAPSRS